MNTELINKLSNLTIYGYIDPSKNNMVVIHFFNKDEQKADIIAFLKHNMSWDVREIKDERCQLFPDKEIVEITHERLGTFEKGSKFDEFVRNALYKMVDEKSKEKLLENNKMFQVLENGYDN